MKCGLLGEKLGHSYSPQIHAELAGYEYRLYEKRKGDMETFLRDGDWQGLNVTIPYKKTVIPFCDTLSDTAQEIGSVNTLRKGPEGRIHGENTDAFGFSMLLQTLPKAAVAEGGKAVVLGTGGASVTVCTVLKHAGFAPVTISRTGENNYEHLSRHSDAALLVNTTPLGMYPNNGTKAVDLRSFPHLKAVADIVYNPARTTLLLQAEELGLPCAGGLKMLVAQAKRSAEIFLDQKLPDEKIDQITAKLSRSMQNIILIGMPGSGKSCVARELAARLGRHCVETDAEIEKAAGITIPELFAREGEEGFRARETAVLREFGKQSGTVISTGGGCVTRPENYPLLHQNGTIVRLTRPLALLAREGRPLSLQTDLSEMFAVRDPLYARFADFTVDNRESISKTVDTILEELS